MSFYDVKRSIEKGIKLGIYQTYEDGLKALYAEEDTHAIGDILVPENMMQTDKLLRNSLQKADRAQMLNSLSMGSQIEGLGKIAKKRLINQSGGSFSSEMQKEILDISDVRKNMQDVFSKLNSEISSGTSSREISFRIVDIAIFLHRKISSLAGFEVAEIFEERYKDKFGELIRKRFEPDSTFYPIVQEKINRFPEARKLYHFLEIYI